METILYKSVKGSLLAIINGFLVVALIFSIVMHLWPAVFILGTVNCVFLWLWFDTYYLIKGNELYYKSAFISGSVSIDSIHEIIRHNKGMHSCSLKPALAMKGLIIKYNRWDDMFISPENQDEFISDIQKINPEIKVS